MTRKSGLFSIRATAIMAALGGILLTAAPSFADGWGAIAVDRKGSYGFAVGYPSATQARRAAVKGCGNGNCRNVLLKQTKCVAMTQAKREDGAYWFWVAFGPNSGSTTANVETWCNDNSEAAQAGCKLAINRCE